jgi:predicted RNase H-like HicB family nuclease
VSQEPRTYSLAVVLEPRDDGMWHAYCPTLLDYGAATWAATREEALGHIREVVGMVVMRLAEEGAPVPDAPPEDVPAAGERVVIDLAHGGHAAVGRVRIVRGRSMMPGRCGRERGPHAGQGAEAAGAQEEPAAVEEPRQPVRPPARPSHGRFPFRGPLVLGVPKLYRTGRKV